MTAVSLLTVHVTTQGILILKVSASLQSQWLEESKAESKMVAEENEIMDHFQNFSDKQIAFVPDHLEFACQEGVNLYAVSAGFWQSVIAVRRQ